MMRKLFFTAFLALLALASCHRTDDDVCIECIMRRLDSLESKVKDGVLIKSVTQIPGNPGGWRIEFTGGTPSSIDIMHGVNGVGGGTSLIEVRVNPDGSTTLWIHNGEEHQNTGINLTGPKGEPGVTPKIEVRENANGTTTVWYNVTSGYPSNGWVNTNVNIKGPSSGGGDAPSVSIVDNAAEGTVTITDNGSTYVFEKASSALRFEIMNTAVIPAVLEGTSIVRFRVNPSTAWIPTGTAPVNSGNPFGKWELDAVETRVGYVKASPNFSIVEIQPSAAGEGAYEATIRYDAAAVNVSEYVLSLVLNTGSDTDPVLISSGPFVMKTATPLVAAPDANSYIVAPEGSVTIDMGQIEREKTDGFRATSRLSDTDNVTVELLWTDKAALIDEIGLDLLSPANSGTKTAFSVTAGATEGNAVVAAKANGVIVWSWHIWVTAFDPEATAKTVPHGTQSYHPAEVKTTSSAHPDGGKTLVFMDRNLGALNATPDDFGAMGMLYQWGRKDPFPSHWQSWPFFVPDDDEPTIYTPGVPAGTNTAVAITNTSVNVGIDYATANPLTFINNDRPSEPTPYPERSWYVHTGSAPRTLWINESNNGATLTKTVYDPCPAGWRVPAEGSHSVLLGGSDSGASPFGVTMTSGSYFPYTGMRRQGSGTPAMDFVTTCWFGQFYYDHDAGAPYPAPPGGAPAYQTDGLPVRCVKITE
ncbi:MAG: hypothetical protein LBV47_09055 [Bacteroidales bacterium]|jgi:hypothetical protein|nr:hypothetical protein [Bacteroidales bacterium]